MSRPDPLASAVVAGATGHVGSALVERLVANGRRVRCLVRDASRLRSRAVEVVEGDLRDRASLDEAFVDGAVGYFLVHALSAGGSLADEEQLVARTSPRRPATAAPRGSSTSAVSSTRTSPSARRTWRAASRSGAR